MTIEKFVGKERKMKISEIVFRDDLYPRFDPNPQLIKKYSESVDYLPPIKIDQHNILIDGLHRLRAHELAEKEKISVEVIEVESEKQLKQMAYRLNSNHGFQLTNAEKQKYAVEMIGELDSKELSEILSVHYTTVDKWTQNKRKLQKEQLEREVIEEYLRAWNTQQNVADDFDIDQSTISNYKEKIMKNKKFLKFHKNFEENNKFLYNIWNTSKGNKTEHFGHFPKIFMDNLLYYHTEPFDIIYDPFCGDGTTIDSCKDFYRRYYCADMLNKPGREKDMKVRKIQEGYPDDLQKPDLTFLDPPYWKQAKGKYSNDLEDLSNMNKENFYKTFQDFLKTLMGKKIKKIAVVISPTQYPNNLQFEDHIFKIHEMLCSDYFIKMRYILPYSTQQYNGTQVIKAKEAKICLTLNRDLVIWELKYGY